MDAPGYRHRFQFCPVEMPLGLIVADAPARNSPIALYHGRDRQPSGAQLLDDPARQGIDIASRVLLDRCDDDALHLLWRTTYVPFVILIERED
jgi:hypothetical protein